jgi:hypothetical protein
MSTPIILAAPTSLAPRDPDLWRGMSLLWRGADGSEWDLGDDSSGVVLGDGVEGLHFPQVQRFLSRSRAIPGHRLRGWRAEAREVFWPLLIWGSSTEEWLERHRLFMRTLHPIVPGRWTVNTGDEERHLELTGVFDDGHAYGRDPALFGWAKYGVTLEAQQPFWQGKTIRRGPWRTPDPQPFFSGPPFTISSSTTFGAASVPNTGDVDVWGVWWATGPLSAIELGVGDTLITPPFDLEAGEMLRIDTDPRNPTAQKGAEVDDTALFEGSDVTPALGMQDYASVPPGERVELHVNAVGSGSIMFDLTPLYFRAF